MIFKEKDVIISMKTDSEVNFTMICNSTRTNRFEYRVEEGQNHFTGFMSFQHFRGERMYSDIVVKPENKMTETETVECYPISPDALDNGREEGWYPDTTLVYIRVLWKEFERERGVYNYDFIEDILNKAKEHKQALVFRLIAHSTRAEDDLPEWLKELIPCPERPPMQRVKDSPTHPLFMELFLKAVEAMGKRFDSDPFFYAMDISLPGAWGEGHKLELYPRDLFKTIVDTYSRAFPTTQLFTQVFRPELVEYAKKYTNVGWRGDGYGEPYHLMEYYPPNVEKMGDNWKIAPVSFEAYWWLGEWKRQGWDIDYIIEKSLEWHISSFNPKSMPIPYEWKDKCEYWISRMGYHYEIEEFSFPEKAGVGDSVQTELCVKNVGVAPCYIAQPFVVRLAGDTKTYEFVQNVDITKWLPGEHKETLLLDLCNVIAGKYKIEIGIISPYGDVVYLATNACRDGAFYEVGEIEIK